MLYITVLLDITVATLTMKYVKVSSNVTTKIVFVTIILTTYSKHLYDNVPHVHDT